MPSADERVLPMPDELGGLGSLTVRDESGENALVELDSVHVRAQQRGALAAVEVEQVFRSDAAEVLEGTFRFPVPEGAIVTGLSMWIDGEEKRGELLEHSKARRVFEQIEDAMLDPALLEWEHGSTFKMRVFPIAPHEHKRLKVSYLAPLHRTKRGWSFVYAVSPSHGRPLRQVLVEWQGEPVLAATALATTRLVQVQAEPVPPVSIEQRADGTYLVARVEPDWSRVPRDPRAPAKNWVVIVDSSRSALEERGLLRQSVESVLDNLPAGSRFVVATSDLELRVEPHGFVSASAAQRDAALRFVEARGNDGATDLEAALVVASALAKTVPQAAVLYLGDCEPTWGEQRPEQLALRARALLGDVPFHVVLLGTHAATATALVDRTNGRLVRARAAEQVAAFARGLGRRATQLRELALSVDVEARGASARERRDVEARGASAREPGAASILVDEGRTSLALGETLTVAIKIAPGGAVPRTLHVVARAADQTLRFDVPLVALPAAGVAAHFGGLYVRALERADTAKEALVEASLAYQVMSKYTSFLVLESEQAYAQHAIERRAPDVLDTPRVTGGDLESASADGVSINNDRIQPGDPEIYVHAAEDAASVSVRFPFGVTRPARFERAAEAGRGAWMVRFLVPLDTAEGTYEATAQIVHRDGHLEQRTVRYTVDRTAPALVVATSRSTRHPGQVSVRVTAKPARGTAPGNVDLRRVELRAPDGTIVELRALRWGLFVGRLSVAPGSVGRLRVVGTDQALNQAVREVELP